MPDLLAFQYSELPGACHVDKLEIDSLVSRECHRTEQNQCLTTANFTYFLFRSWLDHF